MLVRPPYLNSLYLKLLEKTMTWPATKRVQPSRKLTQLLDTAPRLSGATYEERERKLFIIIEMWLLEDDRCQFRITRKWDAKHKKAVIEKNGDFGCSSVDPKPGTAPHNRSTVNKVKISLNMIDTIIETSNSLEDGPILHLLFKLFVKVFFQTLCQNFAPKKISFWKSVSFPVRWRLDIAS